jgi:hypothetical protein
MGVLLTDPALALADADCIFAERTSPLETKVFIDRPEVAPRETTSTMIVCGDCGGDGLNPRKTILTKQGRCAGCGGRSYVLAVNLEIARRINVALAEIQIISFS